MECIGCPQINLVLIGLVVISFILFGAYTSVIRKRNNLLEAKSGIDVQLQKRQNVITNILTIAKKFMEHEKGLLTEITELRTSVAKPNVAQKEKFDLENQLGLKVNQLMLQVENYPDLKSDQTMIQAMKTYNEIEENIAAARRFYNSSIKEVKNAVEIPPTSFFAYLVNLSKFPFYEADASAAKPVNAADFL